jgi:AraC-like DNA-binding protein
MSWTAKETLMNNYLRKYRQRKYLLRIIMSINLLIIFFMLVSLLAAYLYSQKISLASQREANEKVLSQMNYNITFMNETVKNFAISFFYDNDMAQLLYTDKADEFEEALRINKLRKTIGYSSFIHSIVIYNSKRGVYYTVGDNSVASDNSNLMTLTNDFLEGRKPIYKMQLMPVKFIPDQKHAERSEEVFSLYMFDSIGNYSKSESVLIINIKSEWLYQKIDILNTLPSNKSSQIFILDQNKDLYSPYVQKDEYLADLKSEVNRHIASSQNQVAQFTYSVHNEKQIVNYMINKTNNWVIIDVQPYTAVIAAINKLKIAFIVVAAISLVIALLTSLFVSNKLYSPIDVLMKLTRRLSGNDNESESIVEKDEISYMSHVYSHLVDKLIIEKTKQEVNDNIMRSYYLRKLVSDSASFSSEELQECVEKQYLRVNLERGIILGVLKIDIKVRSSGIKRDFDLKLLYFAISNIILEIVAEESVTIKGDVVEIRGEHLVLIFEVGEARIDLDDQMELILKRAQKIVNDYYHITFTVTLTEHIQGYSGISLHYKHALENQIYRMNYGNNSVITPQMVKRNMMNKEIQIPLELERKFIEAIKSNRQELVYQQLEKIHEEITEMNSDAVIQSVIHLSIIIKQTLREINQNKLSPIIIDLSSIDQLVFEKEILEDIFAEFEAILGGIFIEKKQVVENKDHVLVDTIKDVVQANYSNANLSLQEIADMLKMSSAYIGKIFKRHETISFAEYLNEVRMLKSLALLEKNNLPVNDIVEKVGYSTQSYFFKMFKKRFGTTPKEYRIKKSLK